MTYDGIVTRSVVNELRRELLGGKIQKVTQPSKNDLVFNIYSRGKSYKLFMSANGNEARINLTEKKYENPQTPPNFCMVLRKHINQGKIVDIRQVGLDRIVIFSISSSDEMGYAVSKDLVVEIMGKYSNIILLDEDARIIDSIKRVNSEMSSIREILPGLSYSLPENDKLDILSEDFSKDLSYFDQKLPDSTQPHKIFYTYYTGLSPTFGKKICYEAGLDDRINWGLVSEDEKEKLNSLFHSYIEKISEGDFSPVSYKQGEKIKDFYCFDLNYLALDKENYDFMSQAIEDFYQVNKENDRLHQLKTDLLRKLSSNKKQVNKKIKILEDNLLKEEKAKKLQEEGDLLTANIYKVQRGDKEVEVDNFYQDNKKVKIKLDPTLGPWENINSLYKRSKKIKNSIAYAKEDLPRQKYYLSYLEQLEDFLTRCQTIGDLNELRDEMEREGLIKKNKKKTKPPKPTKPLHFMTKDGKDIYVGKNSRQNDYITLKLANKEDYFFHVKDFPGSHVIMRGGEVTEDDLKAASFLAAKNSSVANDKKVDIDFTQKKNVYKAKGAKDGMVYYTNFKTIRVDMEENFEDLYEKVD